MRFAIAALSHETNTYATEISGYTDRDKFSIRIGDQILGYAGMDTYTGGAIDECTRRGIEIVPLITANAAPSGTIAAGVYDEFKEAILEGLRNNPDIDALILEVHGAGVAENASDLEGDLVTAIREVVGPDLPITSALDLHGNITSAMATGFDALIGNHLYPHTDCGARGVEAVSIAVDMVEGRTKPVTEVVTIPMLMPTATTEPGFPAAEMNEVARLIEQRPGVVDCTVFHGFPFSDTPHVGVHVVCTTNDDRELARKCANEMAAWIWESRQRFIVESHTPDSALQTAASLNAEGRMPVVINETSDNPGGGSPGDGTHLLAAMLRHQIPGSAFAMLCDPEAVQEAIRAGVGNKADLTIGGRHGPLHGEPLKVSARVRTITDGRIVLTHMMRGLPMNLGPSVGIRVGEVDLVIVSRPQQTFDTGIFLLHGIDTSKCTVVGLKSSQHFRAGFRDIASDIITAESPGLTTQNVEVFDHPSFDGALWPTDPATTWSPV